MDPNKRTRSVRSLLPGRGSKSDLRADEPSSPVESASPSTASPRHPLAQQTSIREADQVMATASPAQAGSAPPRAQGHQPSGSIEQSVRIFRIYEALRHSDTAAIDKAVRDTAPRDGGSRESSSSFGTGLEGTSVLHLAVQCAEQPTVEHVLTSPQITQDVNARDKEGNTPLHVASSLSRPSIVKLLLLQKGINDSLTNYQGKTALDLAKSPDVFEQLQLARSMYIEKTIKHLQNLVAQGEYDVIEELLLDDHFKSAVNVNGGELASDPAIVESGGSLLHEAAKKRDHKLIQILLLNGADPFQRDRKGKLPQDITKDDRTRAILKKSPAAAVAQRGIQEKTILGSGNPQALTGATTGENALGGKEGREMKGYLKKWVNYTTGYKLRWFVLEDGVLSYYKHQDDAGSACRGAVNTRIATLHVDAQDKLRFEIIGRSSVKYHLKANHQVEAKRWIWTLQNAIQYSKDEAKQVAKTQDIQSDRFRQAKKAQNQSNIEYAESHGHASKTSNLSNTLERTSTADDEFDDEASIDNSYIADDRGVSRSTTAVEIPGEDDEPADDVSEIDVQGDKKDAFLIAAHSARLQLDMLSHMSSALQGEKQKNPNTTLSSSATSQALDSFESAVGNLNGLLNDLGRIARDRENFWQSRLEQELTVRRIWEENMLKIAKEQEELETRIGESEEKRKQAKRALREVLDGQLSPQADDIANDDEPLGAASPAVRPTSAPRTASAQFSRRKSTAAELHVIAAIDSDDDDDGEFFDAVDAGEVEVMEELPPAYTEPTAVSKTVDGASDVASKESSIQVSYKGYEDPIRTKLKLDADNRPKISLWGILKSMIGKDMSKMTLPVSFNEPTSLLQRVAEDMEYTELLDTAAERADSLERMLYVAAFAVSEYASTIGRVAKPFNPLLGETYEYVRPDKGFRFFVEQVSHHPPVGAAWAESARWDYYGESAVKSKFYGKSFDINPLGTWFLRLRPTVGGTGKQPAEELYTWKKVTSSVIGIITGNPTVDNYGPMEIRNHTTGEVCLLEFKQRGWKASSAYQVNGKILDRDGNTCWSIGGRWNEKVYARLTPGFEDDNIASSAKKAPGAKDPNVAFALWESAPRPANIAFNLTSFGVTLNAIPDNLKPHLPPTDTRLRPDQRAMEDGVYDFAADEKNRLEEKQRAKRRVRETSGDAYSPKWFSKAVCPDTGEEYWVARGSRLDGAGGGGALQYWQHRAARDWTPCEDIF